MATHRIQEHRSYAHLHVGILSDPDVRGLTDEAFRLWVMAIVRGAAVERSEMLTIGGHRTVSAWSGLESGQIDRAVAELIEAGFLNLISKSDDGVLTLQIRNLVRYQTTPRQDEDDEFDDSEELLTVTALRLKLRKLLDDDADAHAGLADYEGFLEQVIPQALQTYSEVPNLADGDALVDEVLLHAARTYCQEPAGEVATRSWEMGLRQLRAWFGAEQTLYALREAALQGKQSMAYVRAVAEGRAR